MTAGADRAQDGGLDEGGRSGVAPIGGARKRLAKMNAGAGLPPSAEAIDRARKACR